MTFLAPSCSPAVLGGFTPIAPADPPKFTGDDTTVGAERPHLEKSRKRGW